MCLSLMKIVFFWLRNFVKEKNARGRGVKESVEDGEKMNI